MEIFTVTSLHEQLNITPCAVALGNFDGLHVGHQSLLDRAQASPYPVAVFTFAEESPHFLMTKEARSAEMENAGVALLFLAPFSLFKDLSCEAFVSYLKDKLSCRLAICGYNFHFGKGASGNAETLSALCQKAALDCAICPEVRVNGESVSSSTVRTLLTEGKVEKAALLLGRPYSLSGKVEKGYSLGKRLAFPTANLSISPSAAQPRHGVYLSEAVVDGKTYDAITNIGCNPTLQRDSVTCETHLLIPSGDLYGKDITVRLLSFMREEKAFSSVEILRDAVMRDIAEAKALHKKRKEKL